MKSSHLRTLALVVAGALALGGSGCSRQSRVNRALARADRFFSAGQYDSAEIEYLNVLRYDPNNARAVARIGVIYFDEGRQSLCRGYLQRAKELAPGDLEARMRLCLLALGFGDYHLARSEALVVLDGDPNNQEAPLALVQASPQPSDAQAARKRLEQLLTKVRNPAAIVALGSFDLLHGRLPQAEAQFKQALAMDPNSGAACSALGTLYWVQRRMPDAERFLSRAAALSPPRSGKRLLWAKFQIQTGHPDEGRKYLEGMLAKTPDYVPAGIMLAELDLESNRFHDGDVLISKALDRDPAVPDGMTVYGRLKLAEGDPAAAVKEFERANAYYPHRPQLELWLAKAYVAAGDLQRATSILQRVLGEVPDYAEAALLLARVDLKRGDYDGAINLLQIVVTRLPNVPGISALLAEAYLGQNNPDAALTIYRSLAKANPKDAGLQIEIGRVLLLQKHFPEARRAFEAALSLNPDSLPALQELVRLDVIDKDFANARRRVDAHLARHPKSAELYVLLAELLRAQNDTAGSVAALQKAIALQPDLPSAYLDLAHLYVSAHQDQAALKQLDTLLAAHPKDTGALTLKGIIEQTQGDYQQARKTDEAFLAVNADSGFILNNLAYMYAQEFHDLDKAFEAASKARKLLPGDPHTADTLGWILVLRHQFSWAQSLLQEAATNLPADALVQYHLGEADYLIGDEDAARNLLQRAVALSRAFDGRDEAVACLAVLDVNTANDPNAARRALEQRVAAHPDDPVAQTRLARLYDSEGNADRALAAGEAAVKASPTNPRAALALARICEKRGDYKRALALAKTAHEQDSLDDAGAEMLGRLAYETGDFGYSVTLLEAAAAARQGDPDTEFDLGEAYLGAGRIAQARAALHSAVTADRPFPRLDLARNEETLLNIAAQPTPADRLRVAKALVARPQDLAALFASAALAEQAGDVSTTAGTYRKLLSVDPQFSPATRSMLLLEARHPGVSSDPMALASAARLNFPDDPVVAEAFGVVALGHGEVNEGKRALQHALDLGLSGDLAAEAKRLLANKKK